MFFTFFVFIYNVPELPVAFSWSWLLSGNPYVLHLVCWSGFNFLEIKKMCFDSVFISGVNLLFLGFEEKLIWFTLISEKEWTFFCENGPIIAEAQDKIMVRESVNINSFTEEETECYSCTLNKYKLFFASFWVYKFNWKLHNYCAVSRHILKRLDTQWVPTVM